MGQINQRGRIGIMLASLCALLGVAASASAECAWVMWEFKEEYWVKQNSLQSGWTILRTYDARPECRADQAKLPSGETGWFPPHEGNSRIDDGFYVAIQVGGQTVHTIKQRRSLCSRHHRPARAEGDEVIANAAPRKERERLAGETG